jgi:hypothetical protein
MAQQSYLLVTEDDFAKAAGAKKVMVEEFLGKGLEKALRIRTVRLKALQFSRILEIRTSSS